MKNKIRAWNYFKNDSEMQMGGLLKKEVIKSLERCPDCTKLTWQTDCENGNNPADKGNRYCDKCNCGWLIVQMESGD